MFDIDEVPFKLAARDGAKLAFFEADAALDAFRLIDDVRFLNRACDGANGAVACAKRTTHALVLMNQVLHEVLALARATLLVVDVLEILVHEVAGLTAQDLRPSDRGRKATRGPWLPRS